MKCVRHRPPDGLRQGQWTVSKFVTRRRKLSREFGNKAALAAYNLVRLWFRSPHVARGNDATSEPALARIQAAVRAAQLVHQYPSAILAFSRALDIIAGVLGTAYDARGDGFCTGVLPICGAVTSGLRLAAALVVLAAGAGSLSGQERGKPPKLDPPPKQAGGMRFEWVREGPAEKCGSACKEWVSAKGAIMPDTAREFEAFARTRDVAGKVVVLESPGGAVPAGLALGRAFRRLNMTVTVGQTVMLPRRLVRRAARDLFAQGRLRVDVSVRPARGRAPARSAGSAHPGAPDLAGRGARRFHRRDLQRPARRRAVARDLGNCPLHRGHGRRNRAVRSVDADSAVGGFAGPDQHRGAAHAPQHHRHAVCAIGRRCGVIAAAGRAAADRRPVGVDRALDAGRHRRRPRGGAAASVDARRRGDRQPSHHHSPAARSR